MKNRNVVFIAFICGVILTSCNNITPKDLTIIDGIRLGTSRDELNTQYDSLKIETKSFYTKALFKSSDNINDYGLKFHVSEIFNASEYRSQKTQHYGLYWASILEGTKNVSEMIILLVHTSPAFSFSNSIITNLTDNSNMQGITQDISYGQTDDIARMLSGKYGKPNDTIKNQLIPFYAIKGTQIRPYFSDSTNIGEIIVWKTKYLDIKFFKGIESHFNIFESSTHNYLISINGPIRKCNYDQGEKPCHSYSYISYKLNDLAIKELELNKIKL